MWKVCCICLTELTSLESHTLAPVLSVITPVYLLHFLCLFCPSCFSSLPLPKHPTYFQLFPALSFPLYFSLSSLCALAVQYFSSFCICHCKPGSCSSDRNQPKQQSVDANEFFSSCGDQLDISPKRDRPRPAILIFLVAHPILFLALFSCLPNACFVLARLH